jgi:DNA sulfur modification protein DndE
MLRYLAALLLLLLLSGVSFGKEPVTIYLAGDSTMAHKLAEKRPETGWGEELQKYFDPAEVRIENHAKNGRSTRTFIGEGLWQEIVAKLKQGDYVLIQFGHNDESKSKTDRYTPPEDFRSNLVRFVEEARAKGANPVLLTPVMRRSFDSAGVLKDTHGEYPDIVRAVAAERRVPLIDMHRKSEAVLKQYGPEASRRLFLQLKPGENANYPSGVEDNTHFSPEGAEIMARLAVEGIRELRLGIAERLINSQPDVKSQPDRAAAPVAQAGNAKISPKPPVIPNRELVITDFGGIGDGKTVNTEAFRKAVAECRRAGGCQLVVPAGTFVTGPIELTDRMALVLAKGATLRGSENFRDYESAQGARGANAKQSALPLISGKNLSDVEIRGEGTIDGAGLVWWRRFRAERAAGVPQQGQPRAEGQPVESPRPKLILLTGCNRVRIQGVTLKDSPQFHLVPNSCHDVTIEEVTITSPADSPNTDGIDPTGSSDVLIRRCVIDVGDDNVSFKSNPNEGATENVLVTDCTFRHGHGASVGSNIGGGIRNVTVEHCTFEGTDNGIRIKSTRDRGGVVENVTYRDITMKNVGVAITLNLFYFDKAGQRERQPRPVTSATPVVRGVRIINVTVEGAKTAGEIIGLPEMPISDVLLENVSVGANTGMIVQDAKAVELRAVRIAPKKGEPLTVISAEVKNTKASAGAQR